MVIGSAGQDGSILIDLYLKSGHTVFGVALTRVYFPVVNSHNYRQVLVDLSNPDLAERLLNELRPDLIFHCAAVHASSGSMSILGKAAYEKMFQCHVSITQNALEWIRVNSQVKLVVALSSQMYSAKAGANILKETSLPSPSTVYGHSKWAAFELIKRYRDLHGIWASGAILFNHSSIRSKPSFLFPQLTKQFQDVFMGDRRTINVRNVNSYIDIASAVEICTGMSQMVTLDSPEDFVFGSGSLCSVRELIHEVGQTLNLPKKIEIVSDTHEEVKNSLVSDITKARNFLDWKPQLKPRDILLNMIEGKLA